jgi:hypothetical protein
MVCSSGVVWEKLPEDTIESPFSSVPGFRAEFRAAPDPETLSSGIGGTGA